MHLRDLLGDGKTNTGSADFVVARIIYPVEPLEKVVDVLGRDASAVIFYLDSDPVVDRNDADVDLVRLLLIVIINVLDGVGKQVDDRPHDELGIAVYQRIRAFRRHRERDVCPSRILGYVGARIVRDLLDIEDAHDGSMRALRQDEEVVYDVLHPRRIDLDPLRPDHEVVVIRHAAVLTGLEDREYGIVD